MSEYCKNCKRLADENERLTQEIDECASYAACITSGLRHLVAEAQQLLSPLDPQTPSEATDRQACESEG